MKMWINLFWGKGVARYATTLVLLLAACAPATAEPTETVKVEQEVTEIFEPTRTIVPTSTATITSTPWPTETPLPYPKPQVENSQSVGLWGVSPDDKWVAWGVMLSGNWAVFAGSKYLK